MSQQANVRQKKSPMSPKLITTKDIFKQLIRRQNNNETNVIASSVNSVHPVHKISDNLDQTRGKSSTQIKKHIFGRRDLGINLTSKVLKGQGIVFFDAMNIFNPQANYSKKFQYQVYKPKPRTKERDQKLLKRLYSQIKQQKQLQAFQKEQRKKEIKKKIKRPVTHKTLFSYAPDSMKFLQNKKYWANFKAKMDKTVDYQNASHQYPTTPCSSQRIKKFQSHNISKINYNGQSFDKMTNSAFSIRQNQKQESGQKNKQIFKTFKNFDMIKQQESLFKSQKSRYKRTKSSRLTHRSSYGSKKNNLSQNCSGIYKHPVSQLYEEAANSIFTQRKRKKDGQICNFIQKLSPFGNIQSIDM